MKRLPKLREDLVAAADPNDVWPMDFVHGQPATGRKIRVLTVVDTFSRYVAPNSFLNLLSSVNHWWS